MSSKICKSARVDLEDLRKDISYIKTQITNVQISLNTLVWAHKDNPQQKFYQRAIEEEDEYA